MTNKNENSGHIEDKLNKLDYWIKSSSEIIDHKVTLGADVEIIVRKFIREYIPEKFGVETGFVRSLDEPEWQSRQMDILFTLKNEGFPLAVLEPCKVFPLEAVLGIMEVTKMLSKKKINEDFEKVSDLLCKNTRKAMVPVSTVIKEYEDEINKINDQVKKQLLIADLNEIKDKYPNPRNSRVEHKYNDMPPRFFYFAINAIKDTDTLLDHIKEALEKYKIPLHGMYVLTQRLYISRLDKLHYLKGRDSFPWFLNQVIDSLFNYGSIPGVIPIFSYFGVDIDKINMKLHKK